MFRNLSARGLTKKCDGTPKCDGHSKFLWSAPNIDGVTHPKATDSKEYHNFEYMAPFWRYAANMDGCLQLMGINGNPSVEEYMYFNPISNFQSMGYCISRSIHVSTMPLQNGRRFLLLWRISRKILKICYITWRKVYTLETVAFSIHLFINTNNVFQNLHTLLLLHVNLTHIMQNYWHFQ
jgi:hypothetical protein